jgi:prepilin-type N-terminal cleavage/methylation domain-containing protein
LNKNGFTLIELLVTIVLFSLLLATALYSFRFISINIRNINNTNPKKAINYDLLRGAFNSVYYYIDSNSDEIDIDKRLYFYFYGETNKCRFITKSSIFYNRIVIAELSYKDKELWYKESKIFDKKIDYKHLDKIKMDKKFLVLSNIEELKFRYTFNSNESDYLEKKIPNFVAIEFKSNLKDYSYLFYIKSENIENLKRLKFERKES